MALNLLFIHSTWADIVCGFGNANDIGNRLGHAPGALRTVSHHHQSSQQAVQRRSSSLSAPSGIQSAGFGLAGVVVGFYLHALSVLFFSRARSATARNFVEGPQ